MPKRPPPSSPAFPISLDSERERQARGLARSTQTLDRLFQQEDEEDAEVVEDIPEVEVLLDESPRWTQPRATEDERPAVYDDDDDPAPDEPASGSGLLPPAVVRGNSLQAARSAAPGVDPATSYLSRYVSRHSRRAMASSLRVVGRLLTGHDVDPRAVPWASVRYPHALAVRARLADSYAWASANRHLLALRGVMQECWRLNLVPHDAYLRICEVEAFRPDGRETGRALKVEEMAALYAACDGSASGRRDAAVLALTLGGGLRRSEVCDLRLEHWDRDDSKLKVLGKGNKWRTVYLSEQHRAVLDAWVQLRGVQPGALIQPISKHGVPVGSKSLTSGGLYKVLLAVGKRAQVADFTPHDLRRTFITRLLDKGADALTVSKLVGHASVQTTMRYDKRGEVAKKAAVALLNEK